MRHRTLALGAVAVVALILVVQVGARPQGAITVRVTSSGGQTVVRTVAAQTGETVATQRLAGTFRLPVVVRGVREGLSVDQSTIVLQGAVGAKSSTFAVLASSLDRPPRIVTLAGRFDYDALSPDGRLLYLTQMLPGEDGRYLVRVYSLTKQRLLAQPVVEKGEEPGPMAGYAVARVSSGYDGWVYTAYRGGHEGPFIHALQTRARAAACIELRPHDPHERAGDRFWQLRFADDGRTLVATNPKTGARVSVDLSQGWPAPIPG
ncbi:MAG: hypothetical protein ACKVUT_09565 [Gaiella sp.]